MKKKSARIVALSAAFTALTIVFMYIANIVPNVRLAFVAVASLLTVAAVIETGIGAAILVYAASALLGLLLVPDKTTVFIYILIFGIYPLIKSFSERQKPFFIQWMIKLLFFNASFTVVWFLFRQLIFSADLLNTNFIFIYIAGNAAFILYDIGLTRLIGFYIVRISKNLKKNTH